MTANGTPDDWCVELTRQDDDGQRYTLTTYGYATEYDANLAVPGLILRHRDRGYSKGAVRRRTEDEAGVGGKR